MSVIYILIPVAILLTALGLYLFFWAVKTEQFDDLEKQGFSILFDDDNDSSETKNSDITSETNQENPNEVLSTNNSDPLHSPIVKKND